MAATSTKSGKKRSAVSQTGPVSKKIHLDSSQQKKKRSQPVTRPAPGSDTGSDSDELDGQDVGFAEEDAEEMQVDEEAVQRPPKDPLGAQQSAYFRINS